MALLLLKEQIDMWLGWALERTLLMQSTQTLQDMTWLPNLSSMTGSLAEDIERISITKHSLIQELLVDVTDFMETFAVFSMEQKSMTLDPRLPLLFLDRLLKVMLLLVRLSLQLRLMQETLLYQLQTQLLIRKWVSISSISLIPSEQILLLTQPLSQSLLKQLHQLILCSQLGFGLIL